MPLNTYSATERRKAGICSLRRGTYGIQRWKRIISGKSCCNLSVFLPSRSLTSILVYEFLVDALALWGRNRDCLDRCGSILRFCPTRSPFAKGIKAVPDIFIRAYETQDEAAVVELWKACFPEDPLGTSHAT